MRATTVFLTLILGVFIVAACGGSDDNSIPAATFVAATRTPRSTPLPPVSTPIIYGTTELPLRVLYVSTVDADELTDATLNVQTALNTDLVNERLTEQGLMMSIEVAQADDMLTILDAICIQGDVLAWVDAFTYAAAADRCGATPLYEVKRTVEIDGLPATVDADTEDGIAYDVIYRTSLETPPETLTDLAGLTICRLGATDAISWVYFSLALRADDVNPLTGLGGVVDVDDYGAMLEAIAGGGCDAGAMPADTLPDMIEETDGVAPADFGTLNVAAPTIPHGMLIAPANTIPEDLIRSFSTQFEMLLTDESFAEAFNVLIPNDSIEAVTASRFSTFRRWLDDANWAMGR